MAQIDKRSVGKILQGRGDLFSIALARLISIAQGQNLALLAEAFPIEVKVVCDHLGRDVPALDVPPSE